MLKNIIYFESKEQAVDYAREYGGRIAMSGTEVRWYSHHFTVTEIQGTLGEGDWLIGTFNNFGGGSDEKDINDVLSNAILMA